MINSSEISLPAQKIFKPEFGPITHFILEYCPEFLINPETNIDENLFREKLNLNPNDFYQVIKDLKLLSSGIIDILFSMLDLCLDKIPHIFKKEFEDISPDTFATIGLNKMTCKYIFNNMKHVIDSIPENLIKSKKSDNSDNSENPENLEYPDNPENQNPDNSNNSSISDDSRVNRTLNILKPNENVNFMNLNTNITIPSNRTIEMDRKVADVVGDMASSKTKFYLHSFYNSAQKNKNFFDFFQKHPYLFYIQPIEQLKEFGDQHNVNRRAKTPTTLVDTVKIKFKVL